MMDGKADEEAGGEGGGSHSVLSAAYKKERDRERENAPRGGLGVGKGSGAGVPRAGVELAHARGLVHLGWSSLNLRPPELSASLRTIPLAWGSRADMEHSFSLSLHLPTQPTGAECRCSRAGLRCSASP